MPVRDTAEQRSLALDIIKGQKLTVYGGPLGDVVSDEVDILLYVALSEEFDTILPSLGPEFEPRELSDASLTVFFGSIHSPVLKTDVRVGAFPAGKMGNTRSANVSSLLIEKLKPKDVVVLGIAGSLSNDMEPGDVFIPDSVHEYLANSAAVGEEDRWTFATSGNSFQTSSRLLNRLQVLQHTKKAYYDSWQEDTEARFKADISQDVTHALEREEIHLRGGCKLYVGDDRKLASGPAVGKGKAFVDWVRGEVDRKVAAIEMESAGVYDSTIVRIPPPRAIAIRGVSDFADSRKEKLEKVAKGAFRGLSAHNACSLFRVAVEAGVFEPDVTMGASGVTPVPVSLQESHVRSVFVIGGESGETDDVDSEAPRLRRAAIKIGSIIAEAGAQLVVCSPFPDSADYYAAMGYTDQKKGSVIQFHSPMHSTVTDKIKLLERTLGYAELTVQKWEYPSPETEEPAAWAQAWLFAQLQALERADAIISLGGKVSQTANTLLHLAEAKGLLIVPYSFLGGAADRAFRRRRWSELNPGFNPEILAREDGVGSAIDIANRLLLDKVRQMLTTPARPKSVFLSFSHQDASTAEVFAEALRADGVKVLVGDQEVRPDQMIPVSIEQAMLSSDVCAILWSRNYALSPWCFDELELAQDQQVSGQSQIWFFNLDDSSVVPARARKLPSVSIRHTNSVGPVIKRLLAES